MAAMPADAQAPLYDFPVFASGWRMYASTHMTCGVSLYNYKDLRVSRTSVLVSAYRRVPCLRVLHGTEGCFAK